MPHTRDEDEGGSLARPNSVRSRVPFSTFVSRFLYLRRPSEASARRLFTGSRRRPFVDSLPRVHVRGWHHGRLSRDHLVQLDVPLAELGASSRRRLRQRLVVVRIAPVGEPRRRNSLSIMAGSAPAAWRSAYESRSQYLDESGVLISSMRRMDPSAEFVPNRISCRRGQAALGGRPSAQTQTPRASSPRSSRGPPGSSNPRRRCPRERSGGRVLSPWWSG